MIYINEEFKRENEIIENALRTDYLTPKQLKNSIEILKKYREVALEDKRQNKEIDIRLELLAYRFWENFLLNYFEIKGINLSNKNIKNSLKEVIPTLYAYLNEPLKNPLFYELHKTTIEIYKNEIKENLDKIVENINEDF